ncbi:MAG: hypothetical protein K6C08_11220 [Oscillospiraceae bacterium]|nr:hypothetical protein [Oscillospiraceae bacterium]
MKRRIIRGIPLALMAIGLFFVLFAFLQPSEPAVVVEEGSVSGRAACRSGRTHRKARYTVELQVEYGEGKTAAVTFITSHPREIQQIGDPIDISPGLSGPVVHPGRSLLIPEETTLALGGLCFVVLLFVSWSLKRDETRTRT